MIAAIEQELGTRRDGTEFPDNQSVMVDGIMIQYVVFLKIEGIVEIMIIGIIPDYNVRIAFDCFFQMAGLAVIGSWEKDIFIRDFISISGT